MVAANVPDQVRFEALLVLGAVIIVVVFLNVIPGLSKPFYLLGIMFHELGHVFAAGATGGRIEGFWVYFKPRNGNEGVTIYRGGDNVVITSAGYLGTTLFGAGLILLSRLPYAARFTLGGLGVALMLLVWLYGWRSIGAVFVGLVFGTIFILVAWQADLIWSVFLLNLVAIQIGLTALLDLQELARVVRNPLNEGDDARQMAAVYRQYWLLRSPMFWVRLWSILSILILGAAFWFTWFRGLGA